MKKLFIMMLAVAMVLAITVPASAFENIFGGYFRTRHYINRDFSGNDDESLDSTLVDTRTRLYYTAKFSDNLKLVTKFEMDAIWGDSGYGDIGADGVNVEVKNTYLDFTLANTRTTLGTQGYVIQRGFLFDDDFSGAVVRPQTAMGPLNLYWIKVVEGEQRVGPESLDQDVDIYGLNPQLKVSDSITLTPNFTYFYSNDGRDFNASWDEISLYYLGIDVDWKLDTMSFWFTGIWNGGSVDDISSGSTVSVDREGYLLGGGGKTMWGPVGIHGQIVYVSGDDDDSNDKDKGFSGLPGQSYYWSEIMGLGVFDAQGSANSPENKVSNVYFANIGLDYTVMENLKLKGDYWYAALAEDDANNNDSLGSELDFVATYKIMDNLNLDLIAAYLFAGDATNGASTDDKDPYELGARFSLSF